MHSLTKTLSNQSLIAIVAFVPFAAAQQHVSVYLSFTNCIASVKQNSS